MRWGGDLGNALAWRPPLWEALVGGIAVVTVADWVGATGGFAALLSIAGTTAILAFSIVNVRIGGMILVSTGLVLDLVVMVINWGMPVSASALVGAGLVEESAVTDIVLSGGRSVATGARLGFLGDVIPLPWGQVISVGDILILAGTTLVTASVLRGAVVGHQYRGRLMAGRSTGYSQSLSALGRGPAPRRGPGLHPSRLGGSMTGRRPVDRRSRTTRRRPPVRPRPGGQRPGRGTRPR